MATIHELLKHVSDEKLRSELEKEVQRLERRKKFGLVIEEHLPEATPLHGIKVGVTVVTAAQDGGALYTVKSIAHSGRRRDVRAVGIWYTNSHSLKVEDDGEDIESEGVEGCGGESREDRRDEDCPRGDV